MWRRAVKDAVYSAQQDGPSLVVEAHHHAGVRQVVSILQVPAPGDKANTFESHVRETKQENIRFTKSVKGTGLLLHYLHLPISNLGPQYLFSSPIHTHTPI